MRIFTVSFLCLLFFQLLEVQACAMMTNSSVRVMVSAYQVVGSVMATLTAKMDQMNTTLVHQSLVNPTNSNVTTSCASQQAGFVTVTTTAWT